MDWSDLHYDLGEARWITPQQSKQIDAMVPTPWGIADPQLVMASPDSVYPFNLHVHNCGITSIDPATILEVVVFNRRGQTVKTQLPPLSCGDSILEKGVYSITNGQFTLGNVLPDLYTWLGDYPYMDVTISIKDTTNQVFQALTVGVRIHNELINILKCYHNVR